MRVPTKLNSPECMISFSANSRLATTKTTLPLLYIGTTNTTNIVNANLDLWLCFNVNTNNVDEPVSFEEQPSPPKETEPVVQATQEQKPDEDQGLIPRVVVTRRLAKDCTLTHKPVSFAPPPRKQMCIHRATLAEQKHESTDELPMSYVYFEHANRSVYRVEFLTTNAYVNPMYVHTRRPLCNPNDKAVQPTSRAGFVEEYNHKANRLFMLRRTYEIVPDGEGPKSRDPQNDTPDQLGRSDGNTSTSLPTSPSANSRQNASSNGRSQSSNLQVYRDDQFCECNSSIPKTAAKKTNGCIYVSYDGYVLKMRCELQKLASLRLPAEKDIQEQIERLNMEPSDRRKNKGEMITCCGNDLLRVNYSMENINVQKVDITEVATQQTTSNLIYIRDISPITGLTNYISLPDTTYNYNDPMVNIHRVHLSFQGTQAMPLWKYRLMQERLAIQRGVDRLQETHRRLFDRTRGSRMLFEGFNALAGLQMGMVCGSVLRGFDAYEAKMQEVSDAQLLSKERRKIVRSATGTRPNQVTKRPRKAKTDDDLFTWNMTNLQP